MNREQAMNHYLDIVRTALEAGMRPHVILKTNASGRNSYLVMRYYAIHHRSFDFSVVEHSQ